MKLKVLVRVLVSAALVAAIVWKVGVARLAAALDGVEPALVACAIGFGGPRLFLKAVRWRMLASVVVAVRWGEAWRSMLIGVAGGLFTPSRLGQVSAALFVPGGDKVALGTMAMTDLVMDVVICLAAGIPAAVYLWAGGAVWLSVVGVAAVAAATFVAPALSRTLAGRRPTSLRARALAPLSAMGHRTLLGALSVSLLILVLNTFQMYLLLRAFQPVPVLAVLVSCPLVFLVLGLPVTVAGLGLREAASAALLGRFGVPSVVAVEASFLLFVINVAAPGVAGAALVRLRRKG